MSAMLDALLYSQPLPDHSRAAAHYSREAAIAAAGAKRRILPGIVRPQWLIEANTEAHKSPNGDVKWHLVAVEHEATIRELAARYNEAAGHGLTAASGCALVSLTLGDTEVTVEVEYEPESGDGWNEPRYEASVTLCRVYLNGCWCDVDAVIPSTVQERWTDELMSGGAS